MIQTTGQRQQHSGRTLASSSLCRIF